MSAETLELELDPEPGWFEVPEDPKAFKDWAKNLVKTLAGPDVKDRTLKGPVKSVIQCAKEAEHNQVELAWVYLPDPLKEVLATCFVELVFGTAGDMPSLEDIRASLQRRLPDHAEDPTVSDAVLPAGPSIRQRVARKEKDGSFLESVVYVVVVPELEDSLIRITSSWNAVNVGDLLAEEADRMAAKLLVRTE